MHDHQVQVMLGEAAATVEPLNYRTITKKRNFCKNTVYRIYILKSKPADTL